MLFGCPRYPRILLSVSFVVFLSQVPSVALGEVADDWKAKTDQWIQLEQRIATEQNDWLADKEVMEASRAVLQREQLTLRTRLEANELAQSLFRKRLELLEGELVTQQEAKSLVLSGLEVEEERIRGIRSSLPELLRERLAPLLLRLGAGPIDQPVRVSERAQIVISILSAIDQFNGTATLTHHLRTDEQGVERDVEVLYWGLAMGYAVDQTAQQAWLLIPDTAGWNWKAAPEAASGIRELIEIHKRKRSPGLVSLPAVLREGAK
jgi:hypothetical protein